MWNFGLPWQKIESQTLGRGVVQCWLWKAEYSLLWVVSPGADSEPEQSFCCGIQKAGSSERECLLVRALYLLPRLQIRNFLVLYELGDLLDPVLQSGSKTQHLLGVTTK